MNRAIAWGALPLLVTLTACPKGGAPAGPTDALVGVWSDNPEGGGTTEIKMVGGQPAVTAIVDHDGEVFKVTRSGVQGGKFTWEYDVPSTGYHVHITVEDLAGDEMTTTWKNAYDTGYETLYRVK